MMIPFPTPEEGTLYVNSDKILTENLEDAVSQVNDATSDGILENIEKTLREGLDGITLAVGEI